MTGSGDNFAFFANIVAIPNTQQVYTTSHTHTAQTGNG